MSTMFWRGVAAGAAGTTALNAATYLDMAVRGRPASKAQERLVATMADTADVPVPGDGETRQNRLSGLGPLAGIIVGVGVGAAAGMLHQAFRATGRTPWWPLEVALTGGAALALADVPLTVFGVSDPGSWSAQDWAGDVVPHLAYGLATTAVLRSGS